MITSKKIKILVLWHRTIFERPILIFGNPPLIHLHMNSATIHRWITRIMASIGFRVVMGKNLTSTAPPKWNSAWIVQMPSKRHQKNWKVHTNLIWLVLPTTNAVPQLSAISQAYNNKPNNYGQIIQIKGLLNTMFRCQIYQQISRLSIKKCLASILPKWTRRTLAAFKASKIVRTNCFKMDCIGILSNNPTTNNSSASPPEIAKAVAIIAKITQVVRVIKRLRSKTVYLAPNSSISNHPLLS